jgi:hypothetical protein
LQRSSRPSDAMSVRLYGVGHVEIDHVTDLRDVDAVSSDVRRDQQIELIARETLHCPLTAILRQVSVKLSYAEFAHLKLLG